MNGLFGRGRSETRFAEGLSDEDLLQRCADRHEAAWVELHRRYHGLVWSIARSFFRGDHATAEDVACAAWAKLVVECGSDIRSLGAWLHRVTYNEAVNVWRKRQRIVVSQAVADIADTRAAEPDEAALDAEVRGVVAAAFARLSPDCRRLLRILVVDDSGSYEEKAALLGCPRGSLGPRRARCLRRLARLIESEMALMSRSQRPIRRSS
jgi:RNA polymerase sigma factor (sigma-70 family)